MSTIYTWGYGRDGGLATLRSRLNEHGVAPYSWLHSWLHVYDIRHSRRSRNSLWSGTNAMAHVRGGGTPYTWLPELGNPGRKLPWEPADLAEAKWTLLYLSKRIEIGDETVFLVCACGDAAKCHRVEVAEKLVPLCIGGAKVVHL